MVSIGSRLYRLSTNHMYGWLVH